jgi:2-polyprenyl-3-methyl-5-hydroxy-6-metoxy-1,4-benzoquinol methylase
LKNFAPLALELKTRHGITLDIVTFDRFSNDFLSRYDAVIVGSDWNQNRLIVEQFERLGKGTILVQSEGMFLDASKWYVGKAPQTELACVWGAVHAEIFRDRGYRGDIAITGAPRLDIYHNFHPKLQRDEIYQRLGIASDPRPYVLFLGQFFPEQEFGSALISLQKEMTRFACQTPDSFRALVKSHPQENAGGYFSRAEIVQQADVTNVTVVDSGGHTEAVELTALLAEAALVVSFSSTASIEAALLGRPSAIFTGALDSPLANGDIARLPILSRADDIPEFSNARPTPAAVATFVNRYLPGQVDGRYTAETALAIARHVRRRQHKEPAKISAEPEMSNYHEALIHAYSQVAEIHTRSKLDEFIKDVERRSLQLINLEARERLKDEYYQSLHDRDVGYRTNNWLVGELDAILARQPRSLVELGCGNGHFLRAAAPHINEVIGVDWAKSPQLDNLPDNVRFMQSDITKADLPQADIACSADVIEHFSPDTIGMVISALRKAAPLQYHVIACYHDGHSHLTVMDPGSWLYVFRTCDPSFRLREIRLRRNNPKQMICVIANFT